VKLTIIICLLSPWFFLLVTHPDSFGLNKDFIKPNSHEALTEINAFQSQSPIGKLVSNKYIYVGKEMAARYFETFDPHYLLLEGDLNPNRTTNKNGPIFISVFILAVIYSKKGLWKWGALTLLPTIFFNEHFFTPSKIPFFIFVSYLASLELNYLFKNRQKWFWLFTIALLIEFFYFLFNFVK
jgi:hypothetical protein